MQRSVQTWPLEQAEGKGPADQLPSPSSLSRQVPRPGDSQRPLERAKVLPGLQLLASSSGLSSRADTLGRGGGRWPFRTGSGHTLEKPTLECEVEYG